MIGKDHVSGIWPFLCLDRRGLGRSLRGGFGARSPCRPNADVAAASDVRRRRNLAALRREKRSQPGDLRSPGWEGVGEGPTLSRFRTGVPFGEGYLQMPLSVPVPPALTRVLTFTCFSPPPFGSTAMSSCGCLASLVQALCQTLMNRAARGSCSGDELKSLIRRQIC